MIFNIFKRERKKYKALLLMGHSPYSYNKKSKTRYTFINVRKREIKKVVEFTPTSLQNLYNLGFGDLLEDGFVDDMSNSNNGDIIKVLSTVIHILKDFIFIHPGIKIVFTGSTKERTLMYKHILTKNLHEFGKDFIISGLIQSSDGYKEINFEPNNETEYLAFFIKKII